MGRLSLKKKPPHPYHQSISSFRLSPFLVRNSCLPHVLPADAEQGYFIPEPTPKTHVQRLTRMYHPSPPSWDSRQNPNNLPPFAVPCSSSATSLLPLENQNYPPASIHTHIQTHMITLSLRSHQPPYPLLKTRNQPTNQQQGSITRHNPSPQRKGTPPLFAYSPFCFFSLKMAPSTLSFFHLYSIPAFLSSPALPSPALFP